MAKQVTYRGIGETALVRHAYEIKNRGKTYHLPEGVAVEVPDEVAKTLAQVEGHSFQIKDSPKEENNS